MSHFKNIMERASYVVTARALADVTASLPWSTLLGFAEKGIIRAALEHTQGNQFKAAKLLGIHRSTLRQRIALYGLQYHGKLEGVA